MELVHFLRSLRGYSLRSIVKEHLWGSQKNIWTIFYIIFPYHPRGVTHTHLFHQKTTHLVVVSFPFLSGAKYIFFISTCEAVTWENARRYRLHRWTQVFRFLISNLCMIRNKATVYWNNMTGQKKREGQNTWQETRSISQDIRACRIVNML